MEQTMLTRRSFCKSAAAVATAVGASGAIGSNFVKADPALAEESGEEQVIPSSCRACIQNCAVLVHVRNGRVIRVDGDPIDPMSKGRVCAKGLAAVQALYNPNHMKYPMKRVGERGTNQWERISWKEAIDTIADALWEMDQKGDSMQLVTSTGGGIKQRRFVALACRDGLARRDERVHHGLVAHLCARHVRKVFERVREHGLELGRVRRVALGRRFLQRVEPRVPQRHRAAAVQHHDRHGRVVEHLLDAAVSLCHGAFDGICDLDHGEAMVGVTEVRVDFGQLRLGGDHLGARMLQARSQFVSRDQNVPPSCQASRP